MALETVKSKWFKIYYEETTSRDKLLY